jgi:hypothetical protein
MHEYEARISKIFTISCKFLENKLILGCEDTVGPQYILCLISVKVVVDDAEYNEIDA